jgi:hypothetical protein
VIAHDNAPEMFKKIANRFAEGVKLGKSVIEIAQDTQSIFASEVILKYLVRASPGAVQRYWRTQVDEVRHLNETDPDSCVAYLMPQLRTPAYCPTSARVRQL